MLLIYVSIVLSALLAFVMVPHYADMAMDREDGLVQQASYEMRSAHQGMLQYLYENPDEVTSGWREDIREQGGGLSEGIGEIRHRIMLSGESSVVWLATYVEPGPMYPEARFSLNLELDGQPAHLGAGIKRGDYLRDPKIPGEGIDISELAISSEIPDGTAMLLTVVEDEGL